MNNFGGQQFNPGMPGRQFQQQQQQQQQQSLFMMGRGGVNPYGGGWGSPSHNPMPPNMNPGGWGGPGGGACHRGGRPSGGGHMGGGGGGQRNKIFGAYGHHQAGNQYKVSTYLLLQKKILFSRKINRCIKHSILN